MKSANNESSDESSFNVGFIMSSLNVVYNMKLKEVLTSISKDHSLNLDKLINKYIGDDNITTNLDMIPKRKRKKNKKLASSELCMARKADNEQCTRRRKDNSEYCGKHFNNLKFGRIDDEDKYSNNDEFIKCSSEEIDGKEYLVDNNTNMVYSYDIENPKIIGKKNSEGKLVLLGDINLD